MPSPTVSDIPSRVLALLPTLYAHGTAEQFAQNALAVASQLVAGEWHGYNVISAADVQSILSPSPEEMVRALPAFEHNVGEHPFLTVWKEHEEVCPVLSDLISVGDFHRTRLYNEFYRQFEMEDQLSLARVAGNDLLTITVSRSRRNFTDDDRLAFALLRPHILCAHQNLITARAEAARAAKTGEADEPASLRQATVHLNAEGQPISFGHGATQMLARFCRQGRKRSAHLLPAQIERWVRKSLEISPAEGLDLERYQPLVFWGQTGSLTLRLLRTQQQLLLVLTERAEPDEMTLRIKRLLPARVRRVLDLLLTGKSEKEISTQLALSRHTVHEYIKIIYLKLGFRSRPELLATLLRKK